MQSFYKNYFPYGYGTKQSLISYANPNGLQSLRILSEFAMIHGKIWFFLNAVGRF